MVREAIIESDQLLGHKTMHAEKCKSEVIETIGRAEEDVITPGQQWQPRRGRPE